MKRFTDTEKWTKDRWFCELQPQHKLLWLYLIDQCDNVGVWEVNLRMANFTIGYKDPINTLPKELSDKIQIFDDGKKWWIRSFIEFQHGSLDEESSSKPIQSYIALLKKHTLWIPYTKGTQRVQGKGKGKGIGNEEVKEVFYTAEFSEWWASYKVGSKKNAFEAWKKQGLKSKDVPALVSSTVQYKAYCTSIERSFKDGQGWLNGRFWESTWTHDAQGTKPRATAAASSVNDTNF